MPVCEVCFEEGDRLQLPQLKTGNGDVLRASDCGHAICRVCMASHVAARVEEQRVFGIHCPSVGCKNELYEQDLRRLRDAGALAGGVLDRFVEIRSRDYTARAREFADAGAHTATDYALLRQLYESTRLCPRCGVAIEKSEGCNSFYCICGHHFNYQGAPRAVGGAMKCYPRVIDMAESLGLPIQDAEACGGDARLYAKAGQTAAFFGLARGEAVALHLRARRGDEAARGKIQETRRAGHAEAQVPGTLDELLSIADV